MCGDQTTTVSLPTGEALALPFGCIDLHPPRAGELLVQAPDGAVWALAADGSAVTPLGTLPPLAIRAVAGRAILYSPDPAEERGDRSAGWLASSGHPCSQPTQ